MDEIQRQWWLYLKVPRKLPAVQMFASACIVTQSHYKGELPLIIFSSSTLPLHLLSTPLLHLPFLSSTTISQLLYQQLACLYLCTFYIIHSLWTLCPPGQVPSQVPGPQYDLPREIEARSEWLQTLDGSFCHGLVAESEHVRRERVLRRGYIDSTEWGSVDTYVLSLSYPPHPLAFLSPPPTPHSVTDKDMPQQKRHSILVPRSRSSWSSIANQ